MPLHDSAALLTVLYDADCGFCAWSARSIRRLDRYGRLRLVPLQTAALAHQPALDELIDSIHAVDAAGRWWVGADAWLEIARRLPPLRPLAWLGRLPMLRLLVGLVYRLVARNRARLASLTGVPQCATRR